jgi:hypothetical protein
MDFEIAVIGVGLARQQALDLAARCLLVQRRQQLLGIGDDRRVALRLAEFDQLDRLVKVALDAAVALDRLVEPVALAQDLLRLVRIVPQFRVLGPVVQLGETPVRGVPVKDASSAAPTTF